MNSDPNAVAPIDPCQEVVLLVHGIRTHAEWQSWLRRLLQDEPKRIVYEVKYGTFDPVKFLSPKWWRLRNEPIMRVGREFDQARRDHPNARISILAHSYGTYAVGQLILERPHIQLHRLILCAAILDLKFAWDAHSHKIDTKVINDCGDRDIWPLLAQSLSWGYGASGTYGFGTVKVKDRHHAFKHSDYFTQDFARKYWLPLFDEDRFVAGGDQLPLPLPMSLLGWKAWKWVMLAVLAVVCMLIWYFFFTVPRYEGSMSDYLNARNAVGPTEAARKEFFDNNAPCIINWQAFVVEEVRNGYFVSPEKTEEPRALVMFKGSHFQPLIPKGRYISFRGVVRGDLHSGNLAIEDASHLKEIFAP